MTELASAISYVGAAPGWCGSFVWLWHPPAAPPAAWGVRIPPPPPPCNLCLGVEPWRVSKACDAHFYLKGRCWRSGGACSGHLNRTARAGKGGDFNRRWFVGLVGRGVDETRVQWAVMFAPANETQLIRRRWRRCGGREGMKNWVEHRGDIQKNAAPPAAGRPAGLGGPFVMCC